MKKQVIIVFTLIALMVLVFIFRITFNLPKSNFKLDNSKKYIIATDKQNKQLNDGGTHFNVYYQIDLNKNIIIKCEDSYIGFKEYKYQGKILKFKLLNKKSKKELTSLLNRVVINNEGTEEPKEITYFYYTILSYNKSDIILYDKNYIQKFINILE